MADLEPIPGPDAKTQSVRASKSNQSTRSQTRIVSAP